MVQKSRINGIQPTPQSVSGSPVNHPLYHPYPAPVGKRGLKKKVILDDGSVGHPYAVEKAMPIDQGNFNPIDDPDQYAMDSYNDIGIDPIDISPDIGKFVPDLNYYMGSPKIRSVSRSGIRPSRPSRRP
tara:strand:- start:332 stop:718 length:387 start_codon:yes stop_codon:yes gene_type:complete